MDSQWIWPAASHPKGPFRTGTLPQPGRCSFTVHLPSRACLPAV